MTTPAPSSATPTEVHHDQLAALEGKFDALLGVYAIATGSDSVVAHRADERFAFCSTFKGLAAAAVLQRNRDLDQLVQYTEDDLFSETSFVTRQHVATGMSLRELCEAAVCHSDATAGNLLLRNIGGPEHLTAYVRDLGDLVTRMDRFEPDITEAAPGDLRDTTTPRALGTDYSTVVLGDALPADRREILRDLLKDNRTRPGPLRVRAGVPRGWTVADKTGTGQYGTVNDVAVVWPPASAPPLVVSIMSRKPPGMPDATTPSSPRPPRTWWPLSPDGASRCWGPTKCRMRGGSRRCHGVLRRSRHLRARDVSCCRCRHW